MNQSQPVAVVTGAGGGMGRAIVADLAATHVVHALVRRPESLDGLPSPVQRHVGDLRDQAWLDEVAAAVGPVDVLVNAAAVGTPMRLDEADWSRWLEQLETNVVAPAELTRRLLPGLRERRGTVIFIGSGASTRAAGGNAVYVASKHALKGLADSLRIDEAPTRVRVVTIAPGQTDTGMLRHSYQVQGLDYHPEHYIQPETVAQAVRYVVEAPEDVHLTDLALRPRVEISLL